MNDELLGMIAALEGLIESGSKVPFSDKVMLEEHKLSSIVQKIKQTVLVKEQLDQKAKELLKHDSVTSDLLPHIDQTQWVQDAYGRAEKIESGAKEYADYVLSNLQLTIAKIQKDLVKLEKNIDIGRETLEKKPKKSEE